MALLAWILVGIIAGCLAGLLMRGRGYGVVGDMLSHHREPQTDPVENKEK